MSRALATIALLILSNTFMTLAWYGHIAFKSKIERFGMLSIILLSWGIALFEYCFQVPANRIGSSQLGGPFSIWELKVIQEVISLLVFTVFAGLRFRRSPERTFVSSGGRLRRFGAAQCPSSEPTGSDTACLFCGTWKTKFNQ